MKFPINRAKTTVAVALVLLLASVTLIAMSIQPVKAQLAAEQPVAGPLPTGVTPGATIDTIAYISFRPDPVGVGQPFIVNIWIQPPLHVSRYFKDFTVTITKPDGTKDVIKMDSYLGDGTAWFEYVADQVGTWKLKFDFLGMYYPAGRYYNGYIVTNTSGTLFTASAYYKPSSDGPYDLVVQEKIVHSWPPSPLPTDYWTRPVQPHNREWWPILGNFPATGIVGGGPNWPANTNRYNLYNVNPMNNYFVPYVQAPNTAHIVWKRQFAIGGLIGGTMGPKTTWEGPTLIYGHPTIIFQGRCYQTVTKPMLTLVNGTYRTLPVSVWQCYDLRTGEVYWELTDTLEPTFIIYDPGTAEIPGAEPYTARVYLGYIGGGRLIKYRPWDGSVVLNISISPLTTGTFYADPYVLSVQDLGAAAGDLRYRLINWTTAGTTTNMTARIVSNITWPRSTLGTVVDFETGIAITTTSVTPPATQVATDVFIRADSLQTGAMLWNISSGVGFGLYSTRSAVADQGKFAVRFNDGYWYCWDQYSGKRLWKGELSSWPWATFGTYGITSYGGMIISNQFDAIAAIDWNTGKIVWKYVYEAPYPYDSPYTGPDGETVFSWHSVAIVADGKLYTFNSEHSPDQPIKRGWKFHCINVTTGEGIWNITAGQTGVGDGSRVFQGAVADGYMVISNAYDGYMYVFGKGKSKTTVTAPKTSIPKGTAIMIEGTVLDMSPAQPGTPCVSKESMSTWMEYLHMQMPIGGLWGNETITGVPVTLMAIDSKGNVIDIGTVTTNGYYGTFGMAWTPPEEGTYEIIASFAGDDSYGSSAASTFIIVGPAPEPYPQPIQPQPLPQDNTPLIIATVAIIIAVATATLLILRKRP